MYRFFRRWRDNDYIKELYGRLRKMLRELAGKKEEPTAAIIDSQSVKADATVGAATRGYDAGKKINGRMRHIAVDTLGLLLTVLVTAASVKDNDAGRDLLEQLRAEHHRIALVWADGGYTGWLVSLAQRGPARRESFACSLQQDPHLRRLFGRSGTQPAGTAPQAAQRTEQKEAVDAYKCCRRRRPDLRRRVGGIGARVRRRREWRRGRERQAEADRQRARRRQRFRDCSDGDADAGRRWRRGAERGGVSGADAGGRFWFGGAECGGVARADAGRGGARGRAGHRGGAGRGRERWRRGCSGRGAGRGGAGRRGGHLRVAPPGQGPGLSLATDACGHADGDGAGLGGAQFGVRGSPRGSACLVGRRERYRS
ncbi:transposase [Streptacidiphilus pinicola]|uniref:transposase n=1 Tax=Streptacidiphilus pinicola TaxID=2219663 RepID=UPI00140301F9|nr:transposase [Streptacidiphilus pinicola]